MKLKYIIIIISIFFLSCNRKNHIDFGKTQEYLVTKNEKKEIITKDVLADYEVLIKPFVDLPLNRYIITSTEITYIGVSFELKPKAILDKFKTEGNRRFLKEETDDKVADFIEELKNGYIAYYHLYYSKKDGLTYLLIFVDKDKSYITSLYKNIAFLDKKINKK
ncbi:MAG: hypothetical protein EAZ44_03960 [Cytophagia bacterium]|nr:MAG: hypothetical protein EAZ44_03960 [Cytophagia bacterium]TAG43761.1 MAG: hypothetical protein EAZ31_03645 [Cytophagia bacterium]TAH31432.1 MAG: hypothetical protein EAZ06_00320 [Cytophagales bacterium]